MTQQFLITDSPPVIVFSSQIENLQERVSRLEKTVYEDVLSICFKSFLFSILVTLNTVMMTVMYIYIFLYL